jgi:hypothetical protein
VIGRCLPIGILGSLRVGDERAVVQMKEIMGDFSSL